MKSYRILGLALSLFCILAFCFCGGCALGVTRISMAHSELQFVSPKRSGTVAVKTFADNRPADTQAHQFIGGKRNGYGMTLGNLGLPEDTPVNVALTRQFADALQHAGYTVVQDDAASPAQPRPSVTVTGEIKDCWMDMYMQVWVSIGVRLTLVNSAGQVLWDKELTGGANNVLWLGINSEFEGTLNRGLDDILNKAAKEFVSDEFYQKVNGA